MDSFEAVNDETLWQRVRAGDEEAFTRLYHGLYGRVYRFAWQMCGAAALAEDVAQEVFLILLRKSDLYDPQRGALANYLLRIARNEVLRRLGRDRALVGLEDEMQAEEEQLAGQLSEQPDPLAELLRGEEVEAVRQAVLALPLHYREVVVLCELEELNYAAAAALLDCAVGTVRSRLHRARALLRERLGGRLRVQLNEQFFEQPRRADAGPPAAQAWWRAKEAGCAG